MAPSSVSLTSAESFTATAKVAEVPAGMASNVTTPASFTAAPPS